MTRAKVLLTENSRTVLMNTEERKDDDGDEAPEKRKQFLAATIVNLGALSFGLCLTWSSAAIQMLQAEDSHIRITNIEASWISSLVTLGAFAGAVPAGVMLNKFGRKTTLQLLAVPFFTSWLVIAFSECIYGLYAARFAAGFAGGAISVAAPMYVAEIAHTSVRGTLGTFFQVLVTVGLLLEYILGGTISSFRILALVSAIPSVLFLISVSLIPETPVYLYSKNKTALARNSLEYFRGVNYNIDEELHNIAEEIKKSSENTAKITDLFSGRAAQKSLVIGLGCMVFQQFSGINAVLFYTANIFEETGIGMSSSTCAILVGCVQVIATVASTILIDRLGRKILLFVSAFVMFLSLLGLGLYFHLKQTEDLSHLWILPILSLVFFVVSFSIGFGPIPWIMMGEIFAPKIKGLASSTCAAVNWLLAFVVTNQFQNLVENLKIGGAFMIFGVICGLGAVFTVVLVPETKGKDIIEVQLMLEGGRPKRVCRNCNNCEKDITTSV